MADKDTQKAIDAKNGNGAWNKAMNDCDKNSGKDSLSKAIAKGGKGK
jgi:hypothetical protein